jgi:hypothetical protein
MDKIWHLARQGQYCNSIAFRVQASCCDSTICAVGATCSAIVVVLHVLMKTNTNQRILWRKRQYCDSIALRVEASSPEDSKGRKGKQYCDRIAFRVEASSPEDSLEEKCTTGPSGEAAHNWREILNSRAV